MKVYLKIIALLLGLAPACLSPVGGAGVAAAAPAWLRAPAAPLASALPWRASGEEVRLVGNLVYRDSWTATMDAQYAMQTFRAASEPDIQTLWADRELFAKGGGTIYDGRFHCLYYQEGAVPQATYTEWDMQSHALLRRQTGVSLTLLGFDTAYDPTTSEVYGSFWDVDAEGLKGFVFGTIDYDNLRRTAIRPLGTSWYVAMAIDADGQLYAINAGGTLLRLDKATGEETVVGSTGVRPTTYEQSATFDLRTGRLYWQTTPVGEPSGLYEVDTATGRATLVASFPDGESYVGLYIESPGTADDAPARVDGLAAAFTAAETTGTLSFTLPATTVAGQPLSGDVGYLVTANGATLLTGTGQPGEAVSCEVTTGMGLQKFGVRASNAAGRGEFAFTTVYVGYDEPNAVRSLELSVDNDTRQATLTWQRPLVYSGVNGGYVDGDHLAYTVTRYPGAVVVADAIAATTFTETLPGGPLQAYHYTVVALNGPVASRAVATRSIVTGDALVPPYFEDFGEPGAEQLYSIIDQNGDGLTWDFERRNYFAARCETTNRADDWLITPPLLLEEGRLYQLRFVAYGSPVVLTSNRLTVGLGRGTETATYQTVVPESVVPAGRRTYVSRMLQVGATGNYNVGFRCTSDAGSVYLFLDSISVSAATTAQAPAAVTDLTLTPAPMGRHSVSLSFTCPVLTLGGEALTDITRVDVYRGEELLVGTFEHPQPGEHLSLVDEDTGYGDLSYTVVATGDGGTGERVSGRVHVGQDLPGGVSQVSIKATDDETIQLSWTAPSTAGATGGYVDPSQLTYCILDKYQQVVATDVADTHYTFSEPRLSTGAQELLYYYVAAVSEAGRGSYTRSASLVGGAPLHLPFHEGFAGGVPATYWSVSGTGDRRFNCATFTGRDADGDDGILYYWASADFDESTIKSSKLSLRGAVHPGLLFSYMRQAGADMLLTVQIDSGGEEVEDVYEIDYLEITDDGSDTEQWEKVFVPLDKFADAPYVRVYFKAEAGEADNNSVVILDDINVLDVCDANLAVSRLSVPAQGQVARQAAIDVKVANLGLDDVRDFTLSLYAGDRLVESRRVDVLASFADATCSFAFTPRQTDADSIVFRAVLSCAADENPADDESEAATMRILRVPYPMVENLSVHGTTLSWQSPDVGPRPVTEDFENYLAWSIAEMGQWTLHDADGGAAQLTTDRTATPHVGESYAYMVYNPYLLGLDLSTYAMYTPHSGQQYAMSTVALPETTASGHNDDWLISPRLSGQAQTVSIWARAAVQGTESFEVLCSATDAQPASFTHVARQVVSVPANYWVNYLVDVPEETVHFALRTTTADGYGLMFDDITYQPAPLQLTGYNVYRDGELLASLDAQTLSYALPAALSDESLFQVTAVYTVGESAARSVAVGTGIEAVGVSSRRAGQVYDLYGRRVGLAARHGVYVVNGRKVLR